MSEIISLNPHAILVGLTAITVLTLGIFVLTKNNKSNTNISFFLLCVATSIWLGGNSFIYASKNIELAKVVQGAVVYLGMVGVPVFFYFFTVSILGNTDSHKKVLWTIFPFSLVLYLHGLLSTTLVAGFYQFPWGLYAQYNFEIVPYLIFFVTIMLASFYQFWKVLRVLPPSIEQKRLKYVLLGLIIAFTAAIDFVSLFGVVFYPFGYISILIFIIIISYAITEFKLMAISIKLASDTIISIMGDALIVMNMDFQIQFVNNATLKILNYKESELNGKHFKLICENTEDIDISKINHDKNILFKEKEVVLISSKNEKIPFNVTISEVLDKNLKSIGLVFVARDMRRIKNIIDELEGKKKRLRKTKEQLDYKIGELEKFNTITIKRELEMIEMKKKIKQLEENA